MKSSSRRRDLPALTGVRFLAALGVFFCHVVDPTNPGNPDAPEPFGDADLTAVLSNLGNSTGLIGVSCFFLLSGFVITWSAKPGDRVTSYWRRRVVKIFPSHAVTWALAMLLFASVFTQRFGIPNLFLIDSWFSDPTFWGGANTPAWSLNAELLFYILFPFLLFPIKRIAEDRLWLWAGGVVALTAVACLVTLWAIPDTPPLDEVSLPQFWFIYFFPPMRLFEFVLGMIVARIVMSGRWPRIPFSLVGALVVGGYLLTLVVPAPYKIVLVTMVPLALAIGTLASANLRDSRTVLGTGPMVWLGKVSFGFFLTQSIVIFAIRPAVFGDAEHGTVGGILLIVGLLVTNVFCGWLLHTCVEQPAMKYWSRSKKRVADNPSRPDEPAHDSDPAIVK
ncbi:acyltransferase family protein [Actinophytocola sp.]|uniref:acyltransferase family protein n=1 Tax=Actinophytocola sp. TaxID=1872138 RepID=UPI003D6A90B8